MRLASLLRPRDPDVRLQRRIRERSTSIAEIGARLDELDPYERLLALNSLGRDMQRCLYQKAEGAPPIELAHFVPDPLSPRMAVHHHGHNTLPLPGPHRRFQKRFCRPEDGSERLFGYNEGPTRGLVGPGYFVAMSTAGNPEWAARGAVVVDYFQVPDGKVALGWPRVIPNEAGLQRFVYSGTRDFMRRVSTHVSIGAAFKGERSIDHYFVLCRTP